MSPTRPGPLPVLAPVLAAALPSCATTLEPRPVDAYLDSRASAILDQTRERQLGSRRERVRTPEPALPAATDTSGTSTLPPAPAEPLALGLAESLATAFLTNRDFRSRQEGLVLTALGLIGARHTFSPRLTAALSTALGDTDFSDASQSIDASLGVTNILREGGTLSIGGSTGWSAVDGDGDFGSSVSIQLAQPLLRGFGWLTSHESLIQAERDMTYAIRDFELFRQDFSIDVASRYYGLVQQKQSIANLEANLDGFVFARRQAEAVYAIGTTTELDVLRARRSELGAQNDLLEAQEGFQLDLDRFKVFLGVPVSQPIEIVAHEPDFVAVDFDVNSAIEVAYENRLDYLNRRDQLQDVERGVRLARDGLRSDLDLNASFGLGSQASDSFTGQQVDDESWSVGLSWRPGVDRVFQRNAHRSAQIALDRALRAFDQFEQELAISIRRAFRELTRRKASLDIQRELISDQERNVKIARLRFQRGEVGNRDVVEATQSLLDARNSLINEVVNYEIARLRLLRDIGILFIDDEGMWES